MNRTVALAFLIAPLVLATEVRGDETPQTMAAEVRMGTYAPDIDSEFGGSGPYRDNFGSESALMFGLELDGQFWSGFGTLGIFGIANYGKLSGKGLLEDGTRSSDATSMLLFPLQGGLVYRFDVLAQRLNIPFSIVLKGGLNYTLWFIRDGVGDVAEYKPESAEAEGVAGQGGTFGLFGSVSLHLLLDFFEPHAAKVFDNDLGVNNSYLFVEYGFNWVDDFGSDKSFDLSHDGFIFGLAFEM